MPDYTGPHDYFNEDYVRQWAQTADERRPFRAQFFDAFAYEVAKLNRPTVLDIGAGPGFLAQHILTRYEIASYHLFDFSPLMIDLSRARLSRFEERVRFHQGDFLQDGWWQSLPSPFDAIVSMQTLHDALSADRLPALYREMSHLLKPLGLIVIADQVNGGDRNESHLLTVIEHEAALGDAGYIEIRQVLAEGDMAMLVARRGEQLQSQDRPPDLKRT